MEFLCENMGSFCVVRVADARFVAVQKRRSTCTSITIIRHVDPNVKPGSVVLESGEAPQSTKVSVTWEKVKQKEELSGRYLISSSEPL